MKDAAPRYFRDPATGQFHRVAYTRRARRDWIGGRGYVWTRVVHVWNPAKGSLEEQAADAGPGERFAVVMTEGQFARLTFGVEDLPPLKREAARRMLTARPGSERECQFVKRTDGSLRAMRFRYDPQKAARGRFGFDPKVKGLLPVWDLDKQAARFINLDGVRTVAKAIGNAWAA